MNAMLDRAYAALKSAGGDPQRSGNQISALCPVCQRPSLAVALSQHARLVPTCNEGCTTPKVLAALDYLNVGFPLDDLDKSVLVKEPKESGLTLAEKTSEPGRRPVSIRLADVEAEDVQWLWPGRIPLRKVAIIDGDPDLGKSTLALDLAARVTTGSRMPDETTSDLDGPADVILISIEDGAADTIRPRADAAGADVRRVHLLNDIEIIDDKVLTKIVPWVMPRDLDMLRDLVESTSAKLIILDPLVGVVDASVHLHNDQETRAALRPLAAMADEMGFAVIALRHINKGGGQNAKHRGGGSIAIIGAARSGLLVGLDPDDETGETKVIATTKHNLSKAVASLKYRLVSDHENPTVAKVEWLGESPLSANALLAEPQTEDQRCERDEIADIITELTADGQCLHEDARKQIKAAGYSASDSTISRAIRQAGCVTEKARNFGGKRTIRRLSGGSRQSSQALQSSLDETGDATGLTRENDSGTHSPVTSGNLAGLTAKAVVDPPVCVLTEDDRDLDCPLTGEELTDAIFEAFPGTHEIEPDVVDLPRCTKCGAPVNPARGSIEKGWRTVCYECASAALAEARR